jgi:hypothetical protein
VAVRGKLEGVGNVGGGKVGGWRKKKVEVEVKVKRRISNPSYFRLNLSLNLTLPDGREEVIP